MHSDPYIKKKNDWYRFNTIMKRVKFSISMKSEKKQRERELPQIRKWSKRIEVWILDLLRCVVLCCAVLMLCFFSLRWILEIGERERSGGVRFKCEWYFYYVGYDANFGYVTVCFTLWVCVCVCVCWMISITRAAPRDNLNK